MLEHRVKSLTNLSIGLGEVLRAWVSYGPRMAASNEQYLRRLDFVSQDSTSDGRSVWRRVDGVTELLDRVDVLQLVGRIGRLEQQVLDAGHRRRTRRLSHCAGGELPVQHFSADNCHTRIAARVPDTK